MMSTDTGVSAEGIDAAVAWHYGDPLGEQRVLSSGAGVIDRSNRDVVTVTGPDRLPWLHSICSQHVADLHDGDVTESLVLSPHGHVEQHWIVTELGGMVWLDTEPGAAAEVLAYLHKMQFLSRVESRDASEEWGIVSVVGPKTEQILAAASLPFPLPARAIALATGGVIRRAPDEAQVTVDVIVARARVADTVQALRVAGAAPAGLWAYEALRVQHRRPRLGFETDHRTIPHEVGWIGSAVHLNKGCYRGQETVARVHNLGRPPRRLVLLHLSGDTDQLPPRGTPVESGGRQVGFIGTALHHHELGPIALAVIKRNLGEDAELLVQGYPVAVDADNS